MKTFTYVEDYIQVINGDVDPKTGRAYGLFNATPPIISLARYDVNIIANMSASIDSNLALTDRQGEIATKIILKYKKQLSILGIDVSPVENPKFKNPLRSIDRRKMVYIDGNEIILKFPYDVKLIDSIRELSKISNGSWIFDRSQKIWKLAITEPNVVAISGIAKIHNFDVSPEFIQYHDAVVKSESIPYSIQLEVDDGKLHISNAPSSLNQYVNQHCGEYSFDNLVSLIDYSSILGYSVEDSVKEAFQIEYQNKSLFELLTNNEIKYDPSSEESVYENLYEYSVITNRFPIFVYEPNINEIIYKKFVEKYFSADEILKCNVNSKLDLTKKVIYFNKYNYKWDAKIPLLISAVGIMHGGEKSMLLQRSEKKVFFAPEVYRNSTK